MARRFKKRIDYAGWNVDIFSNDTKIDRLLDAQGWKGFGVYFYLCQMAFGGEGYYYPWCYDLCATTARKMGGGMGAETVAESVKTCLQIGLFDKGLFEEWGILTSRGIQNSYLVVLHNKNRSGTELIREYWLLDIADFEKDKKYRGVIFVSIFKENQQKLGVNADSLGVNADSLGQEDSIVEDSIVDNTPLYPPCENSPDVLFEKFWENYPNKIRRSLAEKAFVEFVTQGSDPQELIQAAKNYSEAVDITKTDKLYHPNNFIEKHIFEDYTNENYKKPERKNGKENKFNNFEQRQYDYDQLERKLLGGR